MNNIKRKDDYNQVCVWEGCVVGPENIEDFEKHFGNVRIQYLEEVLTKPSQDNFGNLIPGTGDRNDLIFAVHDQDLGTFAIDRLAYGIRWIEDVLSETNNSAHLYDPRLQDYCGW